jgi:hypothetical protein
MTHRSPNWRARLRDSSHRSLPGRVIPLEEVEPPKAHQEDGLRGTIPAGTGDDQPLLPQGKREVVVAALLGLQALVRQSDKQNPRIAQFSRERDRFGVIAISSGIVTALPPEERILPP